MKYRSSNQTYALVHESPDYTATDTKDIGINGKPLTFYLNDTVPVRVSVYVCLSLIYTFHDVISIYNFGI